MYGRAGLAENLQSDVLAIVKTNRLHPYGKFVAKRLFDLQIFNGLYRISGRDHVVYEQNVGETVRIFRILGKTVLGLHIVRPFLIKDLLVENCDLNISADLGSATAHSIKFITHGKACVQIREISILKQVGVLGRIILLREKVNEIKVVNIARQDGIRGNGTLADGSVKGLYRRNGEFVKEGFSLYQGAVIFVIAKPNLNIEETIAELVSDHVNGVIAPFVSVVDHFGRESLGCITVGAGIKYDARAEVCVIRNADVIVRIHIDFCIEADLIKGAQVKTHLRFGSIVHSGRSKSCSATLVGFDHEHVIVLAIHNGKTGVLAIGFLIPIHGSGGNNAVL